MKEKWKKIVAVSFSALTDDTSKVDLNNPETYLPVCVEYSENIKTHEMMCTRYYISDLMHEKTKVEIKTGKDYDSFKDFLNDRFGAEKICILGENKNLIFPVEKEMNK